MSTYHTSTGKTIDEAFKIYHEQNPIVWEMFVKTVNDLLARGKTKMSAKTILGKIRWDMYFEAKGNEVYRINDAFSARYARLWLQKYPDYADVFDYRDLRS